MADRWYYTLDGQTFGPITAEGLMQLAAVGRLGPTDLIWPEGKDRAQAVEARVALDLSAPAAPAKASSYSSGALPRLWVWNACQRKGGIGVGMV